MLPFTQKARKNAASKQIAPSNILLAFLKNFMRTFYQIRVPAVNLQPRYAEIPNGAGGRSFVASSRSIWNVDLAVFRSRHHLQAKLRAPHIPAESPDAA